MNSRSVIVYFWVDSLALGVCAWRKMNGALSSVESKAWAKFVLAKIGSASGLHDHDDNTVALANHIVGTCR